MKDEDTSPDERMDHLRQFRKQVQAYIGREERSEALQELRRRAYAHYVALEILQDAHRLTNQQLARWESIKAEYVCELEEMFSETL